jgi:hypothetical protein
MIGVDTTSNRITDISNATGLKKHSSLLFCSLVDYVSMRFIFIPVDDIVVTAPAFWLGSQGSNSVMDVIFAVCYEVVVCLILDHGVMDIASACCTEIPGSIPGFLLKLYIRYFKNFH